MTAWRPDLKADGEAIGQVVTVFDGQAPESIVCLLEPPRNAMSAEQYRAAQVNHAKLLAKVPFRDYVLGLQQPALVEAQRLDWPGELQAVPDHYIENGGFGVVAAASRAAPRPRLVAVEPVDVFQEYQHTEAAASSLLLEAAPLFRSLHEAYRQVISTKATPKFAEALELIWALRREDGPAVAGIVARLTALAESAGLDASAGEWEPIALFRRVSQWEAGLRSRELELTEERTRLTHAVRAATGAKESILAWSAESTRPNGQLPAALPRRSAWELLRYHVLYRRTKVDELEGLLAQIEEVLHREVIPAPPQGAENVVAEIGTYAADPYTVESAPGRDKIAMLGSQGEKSSTLLELAAVLELDLTAYPLLHEHVQYSAAAQRLLDLGGGSSSAAVIRLALERVGVALARRLATTDLDRSMLTQEPTARFLEAASRFRLSHEDNLRSVLLSFSCSTTAQLLERMGADLPPGWARQADRIDGKVSVLRDFFDLSITRGKDIAPTLCEEMARARLSNGVVFCDSFLYPHLTRWFEGHDVSYCCVFPNW